MIGANWVKVNNNKFQDTLENISIYDVYSHKKCSTKEKNKVNNIQNQIQFISKHVYTGDICTQARTRESLGSR